MNVTNRPVRQPPPPRQEPIPQRTSGEVRGGPVNQARLADSFDNPKSLEKTSPASPPKPKKKESGPGFFGRLWNGVRSGFIGGVRALVGGAVRLFGGRIGPHSPLPPNMRTYGELTDRQQRLLGAGGQPAWDALPSRNKAAYIVLTQQMDRLGVDYSGMQLKGGTAGIHVDRLLLEQSPSDPAGQQRFQASIQAGLGARRFESDGVDGSLHPGMDQFGVRQNVARESMQIGLGPDGAFVDIDRYNPKKNVFGHLCEVFMPGETDMGQVARALGIDLASGIKAPAPAPTR